MKYVAAPLLAAATLLLVCHAGWADSKEGPRRWTRVACQQGGSSGRIWKPIAARSWSIIFMRSA